MRFARKYWQYILLGLLCLTPLLWFVGKGPQVLINGVDTNFPLDPLVWFKRRLFSWNSVTNLGSDFSSSTAGLFFHLIQVIPSLLDLSLRNIQIISLIFWFSAIVFGSFMLSKVVVPKNKIGQVIFVAIYSFNTYLFNTWENVKVSNLALVAALPIFVYVIYSWHKGLIKNYKAILILVIASIIATGSGINPAYFSVLFLVIIIEALLLGKPFHKGLIALLILALINLFWILPLLVFLFTNQTHNLSDMGLTNWLNSLSENTSLLNVIRLQGAWDWHALDKSGMPQYLPYTLNYLYKLPFIVFGFAIPFLVFISFLFYQKERRFWYIFFGSLTFLGIFLGLGSHPPTGAIFKYFYTHIPFLSFFRSPWYVFTPILIVSYAGLVAILYDNLSLHFSNKNLRLVMPIFAILFLVSYGFYNYPLIQGKIFRPGKDGFYVEFSDYVYSSKDWLKEQGASNGRIISYPDDQLESFSWGYKGTESILSLFSEREMVVPSFNIPFKSFSKMLESFHSYLKTGEFTAAIAVMNFTASDTIFYKKDVITISPPIGDGIKNLVDTVNFGEWSFMRPKSEVSKKIFAPQKVYLNTSGNDDYIYALPLLGKSAVVVDEAKGDYSIITSAVNVKGGEIGSNSIQNYYVDLPRKGEFNIAIEKKFVLREGLVVKLDSKSVSGGLVSQKDNFYVLGPIAIDKGHHLLEVAYPPASNLLSASDFSSFSEESGLRTEELPGDISRTLIAYNSRNETKKLTLNVKDFNPFVNYIVGFDYKYLYGSVPLIDVIQSAPTSPLKTLPVYPGSNMDWQSTVKIFEPVAAFSKLELFVKMPPNKPGDASKSYLENIFVKRIFDNRVFVVENVNEQNAKSVPVVSFSKISPVKYKIETSGVNSGDGFILAFLEGYSNGWKLNFPKGVTSDDISHITLDGYANGWYLPQGLENTQATIYYWPQNYFLAGGLISISTIIFSIGWSLYKKRRNV